MKTILKWAGYALAGVAILLFLVAGGAFALSEVLIRWPIGDPPQVALSPAVDPGNVDRGAVDRGRRVAVLNGCHDCHGARLEGKLFHDEMPIIKAWGPNLSRALASQSDADFDRAIRQGVSADGRRMWIMPSNAFAYLEDAEMADLMAYLRTFEATGEVQPRSQIGHLGRVAILLGKFRSEPDIIAAQAGVRLEDLGPQHAAGRGLARTCIECHGADLKGNPLLRAPGLDMVAAYAPDDFERLLRTGVAAGDRKLGLMAAVARSRFSTLSPDEMEQLRGYLKARAEARFALAQAPTQP
jgi:cytochrome c553